MRKQIKKLTALLCVAAVLLVSMPAAFAASDEVIATGTGGEGITWTLTRDGILTVSGNGPIVDDVTVGIDYDDVEYTQINDCIAWQLESALEEYTKDMDVEEKARARFEFVKELVIEEGITEIPGSEFADFYPERITLPSTLKKIGFASVNACFARALTINSKDLDVIGAIVIAAHAEDAEAYGSLEEAIEAVVAYEVSLSDTFEKVSYIYDLGAVFETRNGVDNGLTEDTILEDFNDAHKTSIDTVDALVAYCIEKINTYFGTDYESMDEIFTIVTDDDGSCAQRNDVLEAKIVEMYDSIDMEGNLNRNYFGESLYEGDVAYQWLTVYAPSGSTAEKAATGCGIPFVSTDEPDDSFLGKVKQVWEKIKAFFVRIFNLIKGLLKIG